MAILKHKPCRNALYSDAVDYLTKEHDEETGKPILDEHGQMIEREEYLIEGINCTPDDFAEKCFLDSLMYNANKSAKDVKTHQYIISFDPGDKAKGLTLEGAMKEGLRFARKNFPGHRILVAAHPDGTNGSGNIHVHIIVSALRFEDREPDATYMRTNKDGSVKKSEYKAGCKHQDTAKLRKYLFDQVQDYCRENGYRVIEPKSKKKVTDREYKAKKSGQEKLNHENEVRRQKGQKVIQAEFVSKKDELRMAIDDAVANTDNWDDFVSRLRTHYTRQVEVTPRNAIPYKEKQAMWEEYKAYNRSFWGKYKPLADNIKKKLSEAYRRLKRQSDLAWKSSNRKNLLVVQLVAAIKLNKDGGDQRASIRAGITTTVEQQKKLKLFRETYQAYSNAAAMALKNNLQEDARYCLDQMARLRRQQDGYWEEGLVHGAATHSVRGGVVKSKITWMQIEQNDLARAKKDMQRIKDKVAAMDRESAHPELREEAFAIDVKISRGVISYKHPDYDKWTRGKTLGSDYETEALSKRLQKSKTSEINQSRMQEELFRKKREEKEARKLREKISDRERENWTRQLDDWELEKVKDYWETCVVPTGTNSFLESLDYWRNVDPYYYEDQLQAFYELSTWADDVGGWDRLLVECMTTETPGRPQVSEEEVLYELERQYPDSDLIIEYREKMHTKKNGRSLEEKGGNREFDLR